MEDLSTCNDLIAKHGTALQRSLSELESLRLPAESNEKIKQVNERATLFRITSNAMINVSASGACVTFSFFPSSKCNSPQVPGKVIIHKAGNIGPASLLRGFKLHCLFYEREQAAQME